MAALTLVVTDAGMARFTAAQLAGDIDLLITEVGLTDTAFVATPELIALPGEFRRIDTLRGEAVGDDTVHLMITDPAEVDYSARGFGLFLDDGTLFAAYGQPTRILQKVSYTTLMIAVDIAFPVSGVDTITFGASNFLNPPATTTSRGVVELATRAEADAGTAGPLAISAALFRQLVDEFTDGGVPRGRMIETLGLLTGGGPLENDLTLAVPKATIAHVTEGTDNSVAVTPASLADANYVRRGLARLATRGEAENGADGALVISAALWKILDGVTRGDLVPRTREIATAGLITGGGTLNGNLTLTVPRAAIADVTAGTADDRAVTPAALANATVTRRGLVELATEADAIEGADGAVVISAALWKTLSAGLRGDLVPRTRTISTAGLLSGGGSLAGNLSLAVPRATSAQVREGTSADVAVTPAALAGVAHLFAGDGFVILPGGLIIQWGAYRDTMTAEVTRPILFPTSFPTACFSVQLTGYIAAPSNRRDLWPQLAGPPTTTGMTVQMQSDDDNDWQIDGFDWLAIGA